MSAPEPPDEGVRGWFLPHGIIGPIAALLAGLVGGGTLGYGLGALAGVLGDLDVVVVASGAGAALGAAVALRGWWLDRRKGNDWTQDPWSADD